MTEDQIVSLRRMLVTLPGDIQINSLIAIAAAIEQLTYEVEKLREEIATHD
jgi:hypothetical protein